MDFDQPPVVQISLDESAAVNFSEWPATIPAVSQLLTDGLELTSGVTFLVGENGSGKSTLVEAIAIAFGLSPEGGTAFGHHSTRETESHLHRALLLQRGIGSGRSSCWRRGSTPRASIASTNPKPHCRSPRRSR